MAIRHLLHQRPVLKAFWDTARAPRGTASAPGPVLEQVVPPRPRDLVDAYMRHVGGPRMRRELPAHLFPQWGFPLLSRTLHGLPYDLSKTLNGGCRLVRHAPLPLDEPLHLRAQLVDVDDDGTRAILTQTLWTGTASSPDAVEATVRAFLPLAKREGSPRKQRPLVPVDATLLQGWRVGPSAGRTFAALTGDVNPIHWMPLAARAAGFRNVILHGFSTFARTIEALHTVRFAGDRRRLHAIDVRFTRPLVLPARPAVFLTGDRVHVGLTPGGPCFLEGTTEVNDG